MLMAATFANTFDPHARLYGAAKSVFTGIVHFLAVDDVLSQKFNSSVKVTPSLYLILTV